MVILGVSFGGDICRWIGDELEKGSASETNMSIDTAKLDNEPEHEVYCSCDISLLVVNCKADKFHQSRWHVLIPSRDFPYQKQVPIQALPLFQENGEQLHPFYHTPPIRDHL